MNPVSLTDWRRLHDTREIALRELRVLSSQAEPVGPDALDRLDGLSLRPLTWRSPEFPERLKELRSAPPVLWALGNIALLSRNAFGLCGSRNASDRGLRWAAKFGEVVSATGSTLVTGLARGVDREATRAALCSNGTAIGVIAEGFERWSPAEFADPLQQGRLLVLSEFRPSARWSVGQAMQRNTTICLLGSGMFVIEAGESGGTLEAGRTALRLRVPLFAVRSIEAISGNELLVREGAQPLTTMRDLKDALRQLEPKA